MLPVPFILVVIKKDFIKFRLVLFDSTVRTISDSLGDFVFQVERFVDKKLDKAEQLMKNGESRTRRWYHSMCGNESFRPKEIHFFFASFAAGVALGIATSN